jgi:stress-induced morphogen
MRRTLILRTISREERIRTSLVKELKPTELTVEDLSGGCDGGTVRISIESPLFVGKTVVAQHRMVQDLIKTEMNTLHAAIIEVLKDFFFRSFFFAFFADLFC